MRRPGSRSRRGADGTVHRARLTSAVDATAPGATCQVVAAPGYGATTLLAQVADTAEEPVVGIRCRADDRLWPLLSRALGATGIGPAGPTDLERALELLEAAPPGWVVVDVSGDPSDARPGVHADLVELAAELPASTRLLVAARSAPLWSPSAAGSLVEIDEDLLALTPAEAGMVLTGLDADEVDEVHRASAGWASAIRAVATRHPGAQGRAVDWLRGAGVQRLLQGWFDALDPDQRDFLVGTSVLDELTVAACDATLAAGESLAMLDDLVRRHRFVREIGNDGQRRWTRHPLLTELLRQREDLDPDRAARHSRAADWYSSTSDITAAMHHLFAAGRGEDAAAFLAAHEADLFMSGTGALAADWYSRLDESEPAIDRTQRLLRVAWAHALSGETEEGAVWLSRLRAAQAQPELYGIESDAQLEGELAVLDAYLATFRGDARTMAAAGQRAVRAFDGSVDRDAGQQAYVLWIKGLQWCGEHARAAALLDALASTVFPNDMIRESSLAGLQVQRLRHEGRVLEAYAVAARADRWLEACAGDPAGERQLRGRGEWAATVLERGDVDVARGALVAAADACAANRRYAERAVLLVTMARLHRVEGKPERAAAVLREARSLLVERSPGTPLLHEVDLAAAAVRLDLGDIAAAEQLVRRLPPSDERRLVGARALVMRGADPRRVLAELTERTPRTIALTHLLSADLAARQGRLVAEEHLLRAADIALATGQALLLLDASSALARLAEEQRGRDRHEGLELLLRPVELRRPQSTRATGAPLSPGELELLPLLTGRDSVADLAVLLGVSANTVKTRLQRLYRKLGAESRDEAIAIARARGVLPSD